MRRLAAPFRASAHRVLNPPPELPVYHVLQQHVTRRRMIVAGTTAALGAAGIALGSEPARGQASIEWDNLDIPEQEIGAEDGEVYAPHAIIQGEWRFRNLNGEAAEWAVYLLVGDGSGSWEAIGITDGSTSGTENQGGFIVRGPVTAASAWAPSDFSVADDGTARTVTVPIAVMLLVRDSAGDTLIDAEATREVPITVTQTGASAALGASGVVAGQDDHDDPTPTVPGGS